MFKVINGFQDMSDNNHVYKVGDNYPRNGYEPTPERVHQLSGTQNAYGKPFIKKIEEEKAVVEPKEKKETKKAPKKTTAKSKKK